MSRDEQFMFGSRKAERAFKWGYTVVFVLYCLGSLALLIWPPDAPADTRIGWMPFSEHYGVESGRDYNETHEGVIVERSLGGNSWLGFMNYDNSLGENSNTVYYGYEHPLGSGWDIGFQLGGVTGYSPGVMPYGTLTGSYTIHDTLKARLVTVPAAVVAFQLLLEF